MGFKQEQKVTPESNRQNVIVEYVEVPVYVDKIIEKIVYVSVPEINENTKQELNENEDSSLIPSESIAEQNRKVAETIKYADKLPETNGQNVIYVEVPVAVEVPVEVIRYVDRIVEKIVYVPSAEINENTKQKLDEKEDSNLIPVEKVLIKSNK